MPKKSSENIIEKLELWEARRESDLRKRDPLKLPEPPSIFGGRGPENITGKRFGRLVAMEILPRIKVGKYKWKCQCDCGNITAVSPSHLKGGRIVSCGCYQMEVMTIHKQSYSIEYKRWISMKSRCSDPKHFSYKYYGGRGVKICHRWIDDFRNFFSDMGPIPTPRHTLDRIDCSGHYEPSNCRWVTREVNDRNRRDAWLVTFNGQTKPLMTWSEEFKVKYNSLKNRLYAGWSVEDALTTPMGPPRFKRIALEAEKAVALLIQDQPKPNPA